MKLDLQPIIAWLENGCDVKEAIAELKVYQQSIEKMNWRRVSEILPEFDVPVLLTDGKTMIAGYRRQVAPFYRDERPKSWIWSPLEWDELEDYKDIVTHWMPKDLKE